MNPLNNEIDPTPFLRGNVADLLINYAQKHDDLLVLSVGVETKIKSIREKKQRGFKIEQH